MQYVVALDCSICDSYTTIHDKLAALALIKGLEMDEIIKRAISTYVAINDALDSNPDVKLSLTDKLDDEHVCDITNL